MAAEANGAGAGQAEVTTLIENVEARMRERYLELDEPDPWVLRLQPPAWLRGAGWLVKASLYDRSTYEGPPEVTLVLHPDGGAGDLAATEVRLVEAVTALESPDVWAEARDRPLAETLGLPEVVFEEWMFDPTPEDRVRREAALDVMWERFPRVAEHFERVYGMRLPRHLAVLAAFWESLSGWERAGTDYLGLSPGGITAHFHGPETRLVARDGLDERLDMRFWCDPPEFVTIMMGRFDGLHCGLWYDDPRELPSFVVHSHARDSGEIWTSTGPDRQGPPATGLVELGHQVDRAFAGEREQDRPALRWRLLPLIKALEAFAGPDREAVDADGPRRWAEAARLDVNGGVGPALPDGSGDPRDDPETSRRRWDAYRARSPEVREWVEEARAELAAGSPAFALVIGLELRRLDIEEYRDECIELLVAAYEALGRHALAEIAKVDHANRELDSVEILVPEREEDRTPADTA